jgi:hypothetical protein
MWLDAADTIVDVDDAWLEFAKANDAPELTRQAVVGRPLRDFLTGTEMVELTALLLAEARGQGTARSIPFRCDSPDLRRFETMTLRAEPTGRVDIEYRLDATEPRAHAALLDRHAPRSQELAYVCSWCKRVRQPGGWREVDGALAENGPVPNVSHGICEDCAAKFKASRRSGAPA